MHNPDRNCMRDARRRNRHLHRVGPDQHRPESCHCAIQHGLRDIETHDGSSTPAQAERHNSSTDSDLEYDSFSRRQFGVD